MIYLDNAATSYPKPESVIRAVCDAMRHAGGNPGRSSHRHSVAASRLVFDCREQTAELFGSSHPENVVFTCNATYAINLALRALLPKKPGHILISDMEHNAVLRPVHALKKTGWRYSCFSTVGTEDEIVESFTRSLRHDTGIVVCLHRSNVCGLTLPIRRFGAILKDRHVPFIVDASQSAGSVPLHLARDGITALCAPGHKSLYGPSGSGFIVFSDQFDSEETVSRLCCTVIGGTGVQSLDREMPLFLPERMESGTLAVPAIAGLAAGIRYIRSLGPDVIREKEENLKAALTERLLSVPGVSVYGSDYSGGGTVLFNCAGIPSETAAGKLDGDHICVRSGFHCAPLAHERLGTGENGAIRASIGLFNSMDDVDKIYRAVMRLTK